METFIIGEKQPKAWTRLILLIPDVILTAKRKDSSAGDRHVRWDNEDTWGVGKSLRRGKKQSEDGGL